MNSIEPLRRDQYELISLRDETGCVTIRELVLQHAFACEVINVHVGASRVPTGGVGRRSRVNLSCPLVRRFLTVVSSHVSTKLVEDGSAV